MNDKIVLVRSPIIDQFTRIIKSLAQMGRHKYQEFLIHPLSSWSKRIPVEPMEKLLLLLKKEEELKSKKLPLLYKMTIIKSVAPDQLDMTIPGNISLNFLKSMKETPQISKSDEAIEFVNILRKPFQEFSNIEFKMMNKKFEEEIDTADISEVENLLKIHEGAEADRQRINENSKKHLTLIDALLKNNNTPEVKKQIISYLLRFSSPSSPNQHNPVLEKIEIVQRKNKKFQKDIMDTAAILIYHEVLKAIKNRDLSRAVKLIGKYTVLFRGNPDTPNYYEVDSFEKKFFTIIEERDLWESI